MGAQAHTLIAIARVATFSSSVLDSVAMILSLSDPAAE